MYTTHTYNLSFKVSLFCLSCLSLSRLCLSFSACLSLYLSPPVSHSSLSASFFSLACLPLCISIYLSPVHVSLSLSLACTSPSFCRPLYTSCFSVRLSFLPLSSDFLSFLSVSLSCRLSLCRVCYSAPPCVLCFGCSLCFFASG